ncbi:MAG: GNAT family N-acetyltransferase [Syntrophales bacterium]|nr:GNAT family N-acetyltransferase [Syntrophales bacterium]MDD5531160.1 GNAT family N-acetyltransferase [Syntrophales bacterium]
MKKPEIRLVDPKEDPRLAEEIWKSLDGNGSASYFLSWGWMENWLEFAKERAITLVSIEEGDLPTAAFFLGRSSVTRHRFFRSESCFLNTMGVSACDALCMEYNAVFGKSFSCSEFLGILENLPFSWDEIHLPGLDAGCFPGNIVNESISPYRWVIEREQPAPYVDLKAVREGGYMPLLSSNTRAQIRRAQNALGSGCPVRVRAAESVSSAVDIYCRMIRYHQRSWNSRGLPGAFSSEFFRLFHHSLITRRFGKGEIQLLEFSAGDRVLGCLYSFVYGGRVHFYQSGFNDEIDRKLKPGYLCHTEAVKYNAELGHSVYDFLAGEEHYKKSLSTGQNYLVWAKIQKPRIKFRVEKNLLGLARSIAELRRGNLQEKQKSSFSLSFYWISD